MKKGSPERKDYLVRYLFENLSKFTWRLHIAAGVAIALALFILNREINPEEGFLTPLIGVIGGSLLIGYFVAWIPFKKRVLDPIEKEIKETEQSGAANPLHASRSEDC
jgi:ABC-type enterochelin transport system permease subunit